jgi:transketolase
MRATFIQTLTELAGTDERIVLLTADLGYLAIEDFATRFPDRFCNVGVAEQNMIGVATGMAEAGFIPFVYSIGNFAVLRPYEFIRNGPVAQRLPVRIVGIGAGMEYGHDGISHHTIEDIAITRVQPGLMIVAPADPPQARTALVKTWNLPGPIYYRIGKNEQSVIPELNGAFDLKRLQWLSKKGDILFLATGNVAVEAAEAVRLLRKEEIFCAAAIVSNFNPSPDEELAEVLGRFRAVITIESHYVTGGLGSLAAEIIAEHQLKTRLIRRGLRQTPDGFSGSLNCLYQRHGLSRVQLADTVRLCMQNSVATEVL